MAHMPKPYNDETYGWNDVSHSFDHPFVSSWSVYSDRAEKEWNTHIHSELKINNIFIDVIKLEIK